MFPKLIAFETSGVLFLGSLREELWGKGSGASSKLADNVKKVDTWLAKDKSNNQNTVTLCPDIPRIIEDALKNGASIALVSRHDSKVLVDRVLYYFHATDPRDNKQKSIITMVRYNEIVNESKTEHFKRIHGWSKYAYEDMVYFDNESISDLSKEGVLVRHTDPVGLTWEQYEQGIKVWRAEHDVKPVTPPPGNKNVLKIAHFNDVYQVSNQKLKIKGKEENIDVTKFSTLLSNMKKKWAADGIQDGLTIFSGDTFSPSYQSSITRGKHMAAVMNTLNVEISVAGNHEFDFGYRRLAELIADTNFPWLLSNITDTDTGAVPEPLKPFHVIEKAGVRIGFIGLVEKEWIATITGWPDNFEWKDMAEVGKNLSKVLRESPHNCDLVFALTHSRIPNDIKLANELHALAPQVQDGSNIASEHGVDLLLGGHDHIYWISKGLGSWDGYDVNQSLPDAANDTGNTLIVKSGTDFQELSEVTLTLKDTPPGSVRKKLIESISGIRHLTTGDLAVDPKMQSVMESELADINKAMADPICISEVELDARSLVIRTGESAVGNWVADCLKPVYNEVLEKLGYPAVDCVIICMGDIRGDSTYNKGPITLGDLMQILPFPDPMVVVEMDGEALWTAMESGLSRWPVQEGRFPAISGFRVEWRTSKEPEKRIEKMWLREETKEVGPDGKPKLIDKEEIKRNHDRKYIVTVGEYMTQGGDGYTVLMKQKFILNGENGQSKSALIRKFLLGAHFVNKVSRDPEAKPKDLLPETFNFVSKARTTFNLPQLDTSIITMPKIPNMKMPNMPNMPSMPKVPNVPSIPSVPKGLSDKVTSPSIPGFFPKLRGSSAFSPGPSASSDHEPDSRGSSPKPLSGSSWNSEDLFESSWSLPGIPVGFSPKSSSLGNVADAASRSMQNVSGSVSKATGAASNVASKATDAASRSTQNVLDSAHALQNATLDLAETIQQMVIASCMWVASTTLQTFALRVAEHEDVNIVDGYERHRRGIQIDGSFVVQIVRRNETSDDTVQEQKKELKVEQDLPVISPVIDGRLKDLDGKAGNAGKV